MSDVYDKMAAEFGQPELADLLRQTAAHERETCALIAEGCVDMADGIAGLDEVRALSDDVRTAVTATVRGTARNIAAAIRPTSPKREDCQ